MKARKTNKKRKLNTKICALMGYYDKGGQYHEEYVDNVLLSTLPKETIRELRSGHDITIRLFPKHNIIVYAKNADAIAEFLDSMGEDQAKVMLEAFSVYDNPDDVMLWTTYDFEE